MMDQRVGLSRDQIAREIDVDPVGSYGRWGDDVWSPWLDAYIPAHMHHGIVRYVLLGILPGSFLRAILKGDYFEAARKADTQNRTAMHNYALFLINNAPAQAFGSAEAVAAWHQRGGLIGHKQGDATC